MPSLRRLPAVVTAMLLALGTLGALLLTPAAPARSEDTAHTDPVRLVIATAGLSWEDISAEDTPALQCLAEHAGVAAMNTTSTTMVSTKRQGMETLRSGYRGLAETASASSGIPDPAIDQWQQLGVDTTEIDASTAPDTAALEETLAGDDIVLVDAGGLPTHDDPGRAAAVQELDARVGTILDAAGGCGTAELPRILFASVAATDPEDPVEMERSGAVASRSVGLQVVMDTGFAGTALTSGATKQTGVVTLTDVLPTILASYGAEAEGLITGQPFQGVADEDPQQLALDRSLAASLVDEGTIVALVSWVLPGLAGVVVLLVPRLARRPRLAAVARAGATIAPLAAPAGLYASVVPWWRAEHPVLALTAVVWAGAALLSAIVLLGPWRHWRHGSLGVSAALVTGLVLLESATGSRFQLSSPMGALPISGGRFYGISNHLFGLVLGAALMTMLCLFTVVRTPRARVIWTLVVGAVVAGICVTPSMGADFGSMLATVPAFGLLALLVSGIRVRPWHVIALAVAGGLAVLGVSFLDWLRPAEDRTHLGRFIDDLLSGELLRVITHKVTLNLSMGIDYPGLGVVLILAILASVAILMPRRLGLRRLAALDAAHPASYAVRVALVVGVWIGWSVNDTGPVLVAAAMGIWLAMLPEALPSPAATPQIEDGRDTQA